MALNRIATLSLLFLVNAAVSPAICWALTLQEINWWNDYHNEKPRRCSCTMATTGSLYHASQYSVKPNTKRKMQRTRHSTLGQTQQTDIN